MDVDLTDDERQALLSLLTDETQSSYPLAPRTERLRQIRDKLRAAEKATAEPRSRRSR